MRGSGFLVLVALALGLAAGPFVPAAFVPFADVIGTLWTNAIRMTVIPLVATLTIASVASTGGSKELRTAGLRAVGVFLVLLVAGGLLAYVIARASFSGFELPPDVAAAIQGSTTAAAPTQAMPTLAQRLLEMVPVNPIRAAADGALLPLVVFALALGFALKQIGEERREAVIATCRGITDAMLVVVGWVVAIAPIGVLGLALALGSRLGSSSVGALAHYIATLAGTLLLFTLLLYPVVVLLGRVSLKAFAAAAAPAQALALGSRSSLAALPLMISAARDRLGLGPVASGFVLPLAVSTFRVNVPMAWVVGVAFLGKLYGIPISDTALLTLIVTSTLLSFSVPGIPSASLFLLAPVLVDIGLPAEGVGILIAVDVIPDMFKTLANVTSHLTSAVLVAPRSEAARYQ